MIPKVIHYCWFGRNEKSGLIKECIESWKKYLPDYEIIEWNEDNFDVNSLQYTKEAYEAKKWAFVSDYVRLYALYTQGGLYFDTDVEVLKNMDEFLEDEAFTGWEAKDSPVTAVMGAQAGNEEFGELLRYYDGRSFVLEDGSYDTTTNTIIITNILKEQGIILNGKTQTIGGMTVYPQIYFCPNNFSRLWNKPSKKSYAIHHFDQSWKAEKKGEVSFKQRLRRYAVGIYRNTFGSVSKKDLKKSFSKKK